MNTFSCPECGFQNPLGADNCPSCLLVFEKHNKKELGLQNIIMGSQELESRWSSILENYEDLSRHDFFLQQAYAEKNLPFASSKYKKLLEINPQDSIARKMQDKIIMILTASLNYPRKTIVTKGKVFRNTFIIIISAIFFLILITLLSIKK